MSEQARGRAVGRAGDADEPSAEDGRADPATGWFLIHRNLLFTVAYEILGSAADAEDVLQETWLRWSEVDLTPVHNHRAYLVRITTRQALSRLRTLHRRKESYIGPWLPEPLLTTPDVAEDVELTESVSMAMLLVLETLSPTERAVFVLREVFAMEYEEIAQAVDRKPPAVRQIARRARSHVAARRPRASVPPAQTRSVLEAFQQAVRTGDLRRLLKLLAPDVVLVTDGGGVVRAALEPVVGADQVALVLGRLNAEIRPTQVNGHPALVLRRGTEIDTVLAVHIEEGLITSLYAVRNPDKLAHFEQETTVSR